MGKVELNLEIDPELMAQAQRLGVDVHAAGVAGIVQALANRRNAMSSDEQRAVDAQAWALENSEALEAYRQRIARDGVFGEDFRPW